MAYISLVAPPLLYMALHMQIRQVVLMITSLMITSLRVITLSSLIIHRFRGNQASNAWLLALLPRLSIKP